MTNFDNIDRRLLNMLQGDFPLVKEPFSILADDMGMGEKEFLQRIEKLKAQGLIREIVPIFDPCKLGYQSTLVAMRVPQEQLEDAAQFINQHPGVSHNYARDYYFNLWFTLAVPSGSMPDELRRLEDWVKPQSSLNLPVLRSFKIGVYFDMIKGKQFSRSLASDNKIYYDSASAGVTRLSPLEQAVVRELQQDIPLVSRPFDIMAAHLAVTVEEFLEQCHSLKEQGIIRRYSASIRHYKAGFTANALVCWIVPPDSVEVVGEKMAAFPEVSHCFERKTPPIWHYNIFTMIHTGTREMCEEIAVELSRETGIKEYILLFTAKEFKRKKIKYFVTTHPNVILRGA